MPADTMGHNNPPAPIDVYKERAADYVKNAATFAEITDANAALATDHFNLGTGLAGEIDKQRLAEKRPHLDENARIDKEYSPVHSSVETTRVALRTRLNNYADAKKKEAARIAAEEAKKLEEAEAARKAAEDREPETDPFLEATAPVVELPDVAAQAAKAKTAELMVAASTRISSASGGRTFSVRAAPKTAEITDYLALAKHLLDADHSELKEMLQRLANQNARAKGAIAWPGTKIVGGE